MEVVHYSLATVEDLDIGLGTRAVRLADGGLHDLHQINLGSLLIPRTVRVTPGAGVAIVQSPIIQAGMWVGGVTSEVITTFGLTQSLSSIAIGDATIIDRWGVQTNVQRGAQTSSADFLSNDWPIYSSSTHVEIRSIGGLFDGTGQLELTVWYFQLSHGGRGPLGTSADPTTSRLTSYAVSFTSVTSVTILGTAHGLETADMVVTVYDDSSPRQVISPGSITVNTSTFDVVITFAFSQSGRVVLTI